MGVVLFQIMCRQMEKQFKPSFQIRENTTNKGIKTQTDRNMRTIILNTKEFESLEVKIEYKMFGSCCVANIVLKKDDPRNQEIHKIQNNFQLLVHEPRFRNNSKGSGWWLFSKCYMVGCDHDETQHTQINYWNCKMINIEESRDYLIENIEN